MKTIPRIGLGTWKSSDKSLTDAVRYAIKECGYCHIDCAHVYQNEALIGEVLEELFESGIKRENLWITSKLWCTHHHPDMVEKACRNTLKDLRIDYIDLYLIHIPLAFKKQDVGGELFVKDDKGNFLFDHVPTIDTWKAMELLVDKGLCKHIGVSNFTINHLEKLKYSGIRIKPYANQCEYNLYMQQGPLRDYCRNEGIHFTGYSNLGTPDSKTPDMPTLLEDPVLKEVAQETGKSPGQVALKFLLQLDPNTSVIPKSVTPERLRQNINLDFELTENQMKKLVGRQRCYRFCGRFEVFNTDIYGEYF